MKTELSSMAGAVFVLLASAALVQAAPSVTILSPAGPLGGDVIAGTSIPVSFITGNWSWADPSAHAANKADTGHAHVFVDSTYYRIQTGEGTFSVNVPYGEHTVTVELVNGDHSSLDPKASAQVTFRNVPRVYDAAPTVTILSPGGPLGNAVIKGTSVPVSIVAGNWNWLNPGEHAPKLPNSGHVHVFLDGAYAALVSSEGTITIPNVASGPHTLVAELVNNDHSSLDTPVKATNTFTVEAPPAAAATAPAATGVSGVTVVDGVIVLLLLIVLVAVVWKSGRSGSHAPAASYAPAPAKPAGS